MSNTKRRFFLRYIAIIQKLRSGEASFEEIKKMLSNQNEISGEEFELSKRTFQRDLNDIRTIFNIDIRTNNRNNYYITEEEGDTLRSRMLETFDHFDLLYRAKHKSKYIFYEKRTPAGTGNFYLFLHAIHNRLLVRFKHEKFWQDGFTERVVEPYALKESHHRWYLLALDRKDGKIKTFGMDRISDAETTREKFRYPKELNVEEMFRYSFGIMTNEKSKPVEIVLSFDPEEGKYVRSLRLHDSQEVLVDSKEEYRIRLTMYITFDLVKELLSFGSTLTVLSPKKLRNEMTEQFEKALMNYKS